MQACRPHELAHKLSYTYVLPCSLNHACSLLWGCASSCKGSRLGTAYAAATKDSNLLGKASPRRIHCVRSPARLQQVLACLSRRRITVSESLQLPSVHDWQLCQAPSTMHHMRAPRAGESLQASKGARQHVLPQKSPKHSLP